MGGLRRLPLAVAANPTPHRLLLCALTAIAIWSVPVAAATASQLPEFNLVEKSGGISTMNMTTGEFSGKTFVSGDEFTVTGREVGNESKATLALVGGSYESFDTNHYEILADGNLGGPGEFHDTNGGKGEYFGETKELAGTESATTTALCSPSGSSYECVVTVTASSGTPTGNATFTATSGSFFGEGACALLAGTCTVTYIPPASGTPTLNVIYSGDTTFHYSEGAASFTGGPFASGSGSKGKRASVVVPICNLELASDEYTCTAQVADASGRSPAKTPTGTVSFTASSGGFLGSNSCLLSPTPDSGAVASCAVVYNAPLGGIPVGSAVPVTASYAGDANFASSSGGDRLQNQPTDTGTPEPEAELCEPADCSETVIDYPEDLAPDESTITLDESCEELGATMSATKTPSTKSAPKPKPKSTPGLASCTQKNRMIQNLMNMVTISYKRNPASEGPASKAAAKEAEKAIFQVLKEDQAQTKLKSSLSSPASSSAAEKAVTSVDKTIQQSAMRGGSEEPAAGELAKADIDLSAQFTDKNAAAASVHRQTTIGPPARAAGSLQLDAAAATAALIARDPTAADERAFEQAIIIATTSQPSALRGAARLTLILALVLAERSAGHARGVASIAASKAHPAARAKRKLILHPSVSGLKLLRRLEILGLSRPVYVTLTLSEHRHGARPVRATRKIRVI